ncbi:MAG TPA: hypothetical protein VFY30_12815 [Solirubrobacterales bacterium]|nr:hypothetical protein [Solirubrobacterales bacterium]
MSLGRVSAVRVVGVFACVGLLLGVFASPGIAKKGKAQKLGPVVTVSAASPTTATTGTRVTATATCPPGKKAFGGGFATTPSNQALIFPDESHRASPNSWVASGSYFGISGSPPPLGITSTVHCRRLKKTPQEVTISVPVIAHTNTTPATAIARCQGKKQRLISGGFLYTPPANGNVHQALVYENEPVGKDWHASVQNSGNSPARTLTGYAYCAKGLKTPPKITSGTTAFTVPGALSPISAGSASCPAKTQLSDGGFISPFPATAAMTARPLYYESQAASGTWRASALAGFGGGPLSITALGICT